MKKLFLLIPALLLVLMASAKEIEVASGTSNIIHYTIANSGTEDGDVLILKDAGPYISTAGADDYTKLVKNLTIKAAPGINPVVKLEVPFLSTGGKSVKFIGITFDGSSLHSDYSFYFRFYDNADNLEFEDCEFTNVGKYLFHVYKGKNANSLKLTNCKLHDISSRGILNEGSLNNLEINGCEIYNFTGYPVLDNYDGATLGKVKINGSEFYNNAKDIISGVATSHADSCIINNCYFHNNSRSAVYFAASSVSGVETCDGVVVKNSTFANNDLSASSRSVIDVFNYGETQASNIEVTVDHCTFYNNKTKNFDYSCVRSRKSTKVSITNSIFAYPSEIDFYATNCYGGTISNTLVYNLSRGHRSSGGAPALTNTITSAPLFTDAANGNFSFAGDWVTPSISPARGAATDGSDLGDPRWYSAEVLPSTDFASPYVLAGNKAKLTGNVATDASNYLQFSNSSDATKHGVAIWKVRATRSCILQATLNIDASNTSGHRYQIEVFDSSNALVGTAIGESANSWDKGDKVISDLITLSEAGDYKIKLTNLCDNSSNLLHSITLSYIGGAVQAMPGTTDIADAWFSDGGTRADGKISFPGSVIQTSWVRWNVRFAAGGYYTVKVNFSATNDHNIGVKIFNGEGNVLDKHEVAVGKQTGAASPCDFGEVFIAAGDYTLEVTNPVSYSNAQLVSVVIEAVASSSTTLPTTLDFNDADLSGKAHVTDGALWFNTIGDSDPVGQWARWEVTADHAGTYLFTMGVSSTNGQSYRITIKDSGNNEIAVYDKNAGGSGDKTVSHYFYLEAGSYFVKVENMYAWSQGHILSLVVTEPSILALDQAAANNSVIEANYRIDAQPIQIIRTIKGGTYNTICLPFDVSSSQLPEIFGSGVVLKELESSAFDAEASVLDLNFVASSSIYRGTPYIIRPSRDIVNPVFDEAIIKEKTGQSSVTTNVDFIGTFIATSIPAGENNLFLGPNDLLYFSPDAATPIKGFRAWFVVHDIPGGAKAIKSARIVERGNVVTEINLVDQEQMNSTQKLIENGVLIIVRDGVRYNVMGVRVE